MSRRSWVQSPVWSLFCTLTSITILFQGKADTDTPRGVLNALADHEAIPSFGVKPVDWNGLWHRGEFRINGGFRIFSILKIQDLFSKCGTNIVELPTCSILPSCAMYSVLARHLASGRTSSLWSTAPPSV